MTEVSKFGGEILVNTTTAGDQSRPSITGLPNGQFVVAWTDASATGADPAGTAVRAQLFNADGSRAGSEFLVNTFVSGDQSDAAISVLPDGRYAPDGRFAIV